MSTQAAVDAMNTKAAVGEAPSANAPAAPADAPARLAEALPVFLRHASPRLLLVLLATALTLRLVLGGWTLWDLVPVALIAAFWPLQEWLIHVCVLHWKPRRWGRLELDFRVPKKHRAHHRDPWNLEILFIPAHSFLYTLPILAGTCWLLTPGMELALTAFCVYLLGTLHYEAVHFLVHTRVAPRGAYYRRLWRNHRLHHFKNERYWYGVTRLEADGWLGTAPAAETVPASPTARDLNGASGIPEA